MKKLISIMLLCTLCLSAGCGVWVEIGIDPKTGKPSVLYENNRLFAPENVTINTPDGWEIIMGEQASQKALIEGVLKLGIAVGSGGVLPD